MVCRIQRKASDEKPCTESLWRAAAQALIPFPRFQRRSPFFSEPGISASKTTPERILSSTCAARQQQDFYSRDVNAAGHP
jgi:hypothetical protein